MALCCMPLPWNTRRRGNWPPLWNISRVIEVDARNAAAWQQTGMIHEQSGDVEAAREAYGRGVETAELAGDRHAADEMHSALQMLE